MHRPWRQQDSDFRLIQIALFSLSFRSLGTWKQTTDSCTSGYNWWKILLENEHGIVQLITFFRRCRYKWNHGPGLDRSPPKPETVFRPIHRLAGFPHSVSILFSSALCGCANAYILCGVEIIIGYCLYWWEMIATVNSCCASEQECEDSETLYLTRSGITRYNTVLTMS